MIKQDYWVISNSNSKGEIITTISSSGSKVYTCNLHPFTDNYTLANAPFPATQNPWRWQVAGLLAARVGAYLRHAKQRWNASLSVRNLTKVHIHRVQLQAHTLRRPSLLPAVLHFLQSCG